MAEKEKKRKKKRKSNKFVDYIAYIALRLIVFVLYLFPVRWNLKFACFLGRQLWKNYHRGRERTIENLKQSFPEKDDKWIEQTGRRSFEHIVMLVIDILFTPKLVNRDTWDRYSTYHNIERSKWMMKSGKGMIFVTGHYANFEIVGYLLGLFGFNIYSIARPLDNRYINNYLYSVRQRVGQKIIDKKGATEKMDDIVKSGGTLCFIADQDAGKKGIFVDFFGRKASSYKSIALIAMQYDMPVGVGYSRRRGNDFFFEIGINRIIMPQEWKDRDDPLRWITEEYTSYIEKLIRDDPSQYWWLHRRWKTRPRIRLKDRN